MNNQFIFRKSLLAASIAVLTACGGSGSSEPTAADSTTSGVITGFGSIYINGVEYETDTASINIDGALLPESELGVGDVCVIEGSVNADGTTGTAVTVACADELEGYVTDVSGLDANGVGSIVVMGQTVSVNLDTVFEGDDTNVLTINDLSVDDVVEVNGFSDGNGNVLATRVETKAADDDVEVKGLVSNLDTEAMTFTIGDLIIDYSTAGEVPAILENGLFVEAESDVPLEGDAETGFTMIASEVEIEEDGDMDIDGDEGDEIEMQGLVTEVTDTTFLFNGQLVEIASLELDDDFDITSLVDGMMITVEGYIDANGDFVVEEIEEEKETEDEVEGTVTAVTETTVTVNEMTFTVNNDTRMMDDMGEMPLQYFSLADVVEGDYVEIEFYVDETTGDNIATELEREDPEVEDQVATRKLPEVIDTVQ